MISDAESVTLERMESLMATSKKVASQAGKDLKNPKTPKQDRAPIASGLAQAKKSEKKKKQA
jgi:hypothetical protein